MTQRRLTAGLGLTACAVAVLTACQGQTKHGPTTYVTVTAQPSAPAGGATASNSASASSTSSNTAASAPPTMSKLPGGCDDIVPLDSVNNAVNKSFKGSAFIVGLPDRDSGRVTYINCRYGVSGQTQAIEIQISLYRTAAKAAARIQPTIDDYANHSARSHPTTITGVPATLLTGGHGDGYGPTLIMAYGQRTIAVTVNTGAVPAAQVDKALTTLAALALKRSSP